MSEGDLLAVPVTAIVAEEEADEDEDEDEDDAAAETGEQGRSAGRGGASEEEGGIGEGACVRAMKGDAG